MFRGDKTMLHREGEDAMKGGAILFDLYWLMM